jgi:hypothetical protein
MRVFELWMVTACLTFFSSRNAALTNIVEWKRSRRHMLNRNDSYRTS